MTEVFLRLVTAFSYLVMMIELKFLPIPSEASTYALLFGEPSVSGIEPAHRFQLIASHSITMIFYGFPVLWSIYPTVYRFSLPFTPDPAFGSGPLAMISGSVIILGTLLSLVATVALRKARSREQDSILTTGVFGLSRNPIVLGLHLSAAGFVIAIPSFLMGAGFLFYIRHMDTRIRLEESHLLEKHGPEYREYCKTVGRYLRWIGRVPE